MCDLEAAITGTMAEFADTVAPKLKAAVEKHLHPRLSQVAAMERAVELRIKTLEERERVVAAKERALRQREEDVAARERAIDAAEISVISNVASPLFAGQASAPVTAAEVKEGAADPDAVALLRSLPSPARAAAPQNRRTSGVAEQPSNLSLTSFVLSEKTPEKNQLGVYHSPRAPAGGASSIRDMFEQRAKAAEATTPLGSRGASRGPREQRGSVPAPSTQVARSVPVVALREARSSVPAPTASPAAATPTTTKLSLAELLAADEKARHQNVF